MYHAMMMQLIISLLNHLHCLHVSLRPFSTAVRDHDEYLDTHRVIGGRGGGDTFTQTVHRHFIRLLHYCICRIGNTLIHTYIHMHACIHTSLTIDSKHLAVSYPYCFMYRYVYG
jgi:hypothetical protein